MGADAKGIADTEQVARGLEEQGLNRLHQYLDLFRKFEKPLQLIMRRKYPPEFLVEAEGRKCVLSISGLRYHQVHIFFTVSQLSIKQTPPFEGYDTFVQTPLSVITDLLERVLSGEKAAFADVMASGRGKVIGPHAPHDMMVWGDVFDELADNIRRLRVQ